MSALRGLLPLALLFAACAATVRPPDAVVRVQSLPGAEVYVDEALAGVVGRGGAIAVGLRAGRHRLEVRAPGRLPAYREVDLRRGGKDALPVELRPDLDAEDALEGADSALGARR
jgi:hypothetical protein